MRTDVRNRVKRRDGYRCLACGVPEKFTKVIDCTGKVRTQSNLTIDHIVPRSWRGNNEEHNLQTLCERCNNLKADTEVDFIQMSVPQRRAWVLAVVVQVPQDRELVLV